MARPERYVAADVRAKTQKHIADSRAKADIHDVVCAVLKTFDGKDINKRIATAVQKKLGKDYSVYWSTEYSWYALSVWNQAKVPYSDRYSINVGYLADGKTFNYDHWFSKHAASYGMNTLRERADKSEAALRMLDQKVAAYNAAMEAADQAYANMEGLATWS